MGKFSRHPGIQSSITLAWNTIIEWYKKTDNSIAWVAAMVLHPRFKLQWFENYWTTSGEKAQLAQAKTKLRKLWEKDYKSDDPTRRSKSPEPLKQMGFLEEILNSQAPVSSAKRVARASSRADELALYLQDPPNDMLGLMQYWKMRELDWPHLAQMAYDFHSIPAMSSECERVFSSCGKVTTPEASRLSGKTLWHHGCLKNWQRRGAIRMESWKNAVIIDHPN